MDNYHKDLEQILVNNFGLKINEHLPDDESQFLNELKGALAIRIEFLINRDLDKLLQILYRIDIAQSDTDQAFNLGEVKKISRRLAEKIIIRQLQKIDYSRKFYKK